LSPSIPSSSNCTSLFRFILFSFICSFSSLSPPSFHFLSFPSSSFWCAADRLGRFYCPPPRHQSSVFITVRYLVIFNATELQTIIFSVREFECRAGMFECKGTELNITVTFSRFALKYKFRNLIEMEMNAHNCSFIGELSRGRICHLTQW
jgi:hypothetical protein